MSSRRRLARSEGPVYAALVYVRFVLDLGLVAVDAARIVHVPSLVHAAARGSFERVVHPNLWIVQLPLCLSKLQQSLES